MKILVVDDNTAHRLMLVVFFSKVLEGGLEIFQASDGEKGLKMFRTYHPDLVLTDINMPRMDGMELLRAIKAESPETSVIVMTGLGSENKTREALKAGALDFFTKPLALSELLNEVEACLKKKET